MKGVSIRENPVNVTFGNVPIQLHADIEPGNATNQKVTWSSDNPTIVTVDVATGLVTFNAVGETKIWATTDDGGFTASSTIKVAAIAVSGVAITPSTVTLEIDEAVDLDADISPSNATNQSITWSSDDSTIATVNAATGLVTGKKAGETKVWVTTDDGGIKAFSTITIAAPAVLTVESTNPTNNQQDVGRNSNIRINFDKALDTSATGYISLQYYDNDGDLQTSSYTLGISYNNGSMRMVLNPSGWLGDKTWYRITIETTDVLGNDGSMLSEDFILEFEAD